MEDNQTRTERTTALMQMLRTTTVTLGVFERMTGVHIAHWRVLAFLSQHPDCTQKELTEAQRVDPASITRTVKALELQGYVVRRADPQDNRLTRVTLTEKGERRVEEVGKRRRNYLVEVLDGVAPSDLDTMENVLKLIEANGLKMNARHRAKT